MNPIAQIIADRDAARNSSDPNADVCFLATIEANGQARVRTLVLREIVGNRFGVYMNRTSPKWDQLKTNGAYELLLFYPTRQRQYRLSGTVSGIDHDVIKRNWQSRPAGSKYMDYYYHEVMPQSSAITSRQDLLKGISELKKKYPDPDEMLAPDTATGLALVATHIDQLDLSNPDRIHDRREYDLEGEDWREQILIP